MNKSLQLILQFTLLAHLFACSIASKQASPILDSSYQGPPAIELSSVQKRRLAERVAEYFDTKLPLADTQNPYIQRIIKAKDSIEETTKESYRYGVYLSNRIHAFALASGDIRIHSGLLDVINSDDEIIALLAYLQTEIRKDYADEAIEQAYNAAIAQDPSVKLALREKPFPDYAIAAVARRASIYQFSLEQLQACDAGAATTMKKMKADPQAVIRLLSRLKRFEDSSSKRGSQTFDITRRYPMATERLITLGDSLGVDVTEITAQPAKRDFATNQAPIDNLKITEETFFEETPLDSNNSDNAVIINTTVATNDTAVEDSPNIPNTTTTSTIQNEGILKTATLHAQENTPDEELTVNEERKLAIGWYVQMSADTQAITARDRQDSLTQQNFPIQLQEIEIRGVHYWRVLVGPYLSRPAATAQQQKLQQTGLAKGQPFVRHLP